MRFVSILLLVIAATSVCADEVKEEEIPVGKMLKGYTFEYQSILSKTVRTYRVRNIPGGGVIPVHWKSDKEDFLSCYIPRSAKSDGECAWCTASIPLTKYKKGTSTLAYGLNKDQFSQDVLAFLWEPDPNAGQTPYAPLTSALKGTFSSEDGEKTFAIDLILVCTAARKPGAMNVQYHAYVLEHNAEDLFLVPSGVHEVEKGLALRWDGVSDDVIRKIGPNAAVHKTTPAHLMNITEMKTIQDPRTTLTHTFNESVDVVRASAVLYYAGKEIARFGAPVYGHKGQ